VYPSFFRSSFFVRTSVKAKGENLLQQTGVFPVSWKKKKKKKKKKKQARGEIAAEIRRQNAVQIDPCEVFPFLLLLFIAHFFAQIVFPFPCIPAPGSDESSSSLHGIGIAILVAPRGDGARRRAQNLRSGFRERERYRNRGDSQRDDEAVL
jgi:hypothetical protein